MKVNKRLALGAAAVAALAVALPASAGQGTHGDGSTSCADGTVTWTPTNIWPPNHKMRTIDIYYTAPSDLPGDQTTITVGMITDDQAAADGSDELNGSGQPTDKQGLDWAGMGNNNTTDEGQTAHTTAQVRSERSGTDATGRTYSIQVMCTESNNGVMEPQDSGSATLTVTVPHDQGNH